MQQRGAVIIEFPVSQTLAIARESGDRELATTPQAPHGLHHLSWLDDPLSSLWLTWILVVLLGISFIAIAMLSGASA